MPQRPQSKVMKSNSESSATYPLVSAVFVNWNRRQLLQQAIQSLRNQKYPELEIIVVDNASTDDSFAWLRDQDDIILIQNQINRGASVARNQGTCLAQGKYVVYMDSDAELCTAGGLEQLVNYMEEHPKVGGISGVIYSDEKLEKVWNWSTCMDWEANHDPVSSLVPNDDPQALSTCFVLFRTEAVKEVGGFDDYYFYLYEDADLCDRLKKRGYKLWVLPEVKILHRYANSGRTRRDDTEYHYYHEKLRMYFLLKNWGIRRFFRSWRSKTATPLDFLKNFPYLTIWAYIDIYYLRVILLLIRYPLIRWKRRYKWI